MSIPALMSRWLRRRRVTLLCMRLDDMAVVHPEQITGVCGKCRAPVGIYPSGQSVLQQYGKRVDVVCTHCHRGDGVHVPAPGALAEIGQSRKRGSN